MNSLEPTYTRMYPDELEAFEVTEAANYMPGGYMSEVFAEEYESDMFYDSAELAEVLREVVHEDYRDATPEEMQEALFNILETMTPAEGFNFNKALREIGKVGQKVLRDPTVGQIARTALPVAGAAVGTYFGGPAGMAIGSQLGAAAGKAFSGGRKPSVAPTPAKVAATVLPGAPPVLKASPKGGSTAAAQLLQLTQNPDMLKSLMALALGSLGRKSIGVGTSGQSASVGALMNLLSTLASKATADADELLRESDEISAYWQDSEGDFRADPAVPGDRAQALYEALFNAENQRLAAEAAPYWDYSEFADEFDVDDYAGEDLEDIPY